MNDNEKLEQAYAILNEHIEAGEDTYSDVANMCHKLTEWVEAFSTVYRLDKNQETSDVEKESLLNIVDLLRLCERMIMHCDDYYRYY